jgi:hypothetical protein
MNSTISYILIFCLFLSPNLFSQDSTRNSLAKDKFALQFQVNGFYFQPFLGSNLSCKYHVSDNSAWRLGIGISASTDLSNKIDDTAITNDEYLSFNLNIQYIHYIKTVDDVSLYAGSGPYYSRLFSKSGSWQYRDNNWSLGLNGIIGVEWFFKKNMSLSGEYGLSAGYRISKYVNTDGGISTSS